MAKFHKKAIAIYGVAQIAEGISAINDVPAGTINTTIGDATVTGTSTTFLTQVAPGSYIYAPNDEIVGRVLSVTSNTALELEDVVPASATPQSSGVMALATEITTVARTITGTLTTTLGSTAATGTNFVTNSLAAGDHLYSVAGAYIGTIASVTDATNLVLTKGAKVAVTTASYTASKGKFKLGLGPKNALAVLNFNFSTELESEAFQYTGDELSRDEFTVIKDKYAKFDFETFIPSLGTISGGDPVVTEVPMVIWNQACGMALILSTGSAGYAKFSNGVASNVFLTVEVRRSSPDLATLNTQKTYSISNVRGLFDADIQVGTLAKLKYNYLGNLDNVSQKTTLVDNFGDQKTEHAGSVKSTTITLSELTLYTSSTEPSLVETSNVCFDKVNAPNLSGFEYNRYLTGCLDGWSKGAAPSDITMTILEDTADATYNPDNHLEDYHVLALRYGSVVGKKVDLTMHKLQLTGISNAEVADYTGQDLKFRNIGTTELKLY